MLEDVFLVTLCGLGTFMLRYLPLLALARKASGHRKPPEIISRAIAATGPAAIAALLLLALLPLFEQEPSWQWLAVMAGVLGVCVVKRLSGSLALSIILGSVLYGVLMQIGQASA